MKFGTNHSMKRVAETLFLLLLLAFPAYGQSKPDTVGSTSQTGEKPAANEYEIGPGDIVSVTIAEAPELSGKFRITEVGELVLPELKTPLKASGQNARQLSQSIKQALIEAKQFRNPTVNVAVDEYHSKNVTVLGAVSKPGIYPLQKRTTVLDAISLAGGLMPNAGNTLTLLRGHSAPNQETGASDTALTMSLSTLVKGSQPNVNVEVHDGDVLSVASAEVVYVVGAVIKPGGFVYPDQSAGMTVLQALALAEGPNSIAAKRRAMLVRRSASSDKREDIPVDLNKLLSAKAADIPMQANDILFIPTSGAKQTLHAAGTVAMEAINGISVYGVGYRVGNLK